MPYRSRSAVLLLTVVALLAGCTDQPPSPDATPVRSGTAEPSPGAATLLGRAQAALRQADAVRVSSHAETAQGDALTTTRWNALWSNRSIWVASNPYSPPPHGARGGYTLTWRYADEQLAWRVSANDRNSTGWSHLALDRPAQPGPPGLNNRTLQVYPVAPVMLATPVKAFGGSDGAVIIAKVPTRLADAWFGAEELLDANGWPGVLDGGVTEIRVFVDDGGFPFKVSYSGADMELRSEVSAYMKDNLAVSQLTAYYAPARLERVNRASR